MRRAGLLVVSITMFIILSQQVYSQTCVPLSINYSVDRTRVAPGTSVVLSASAGTYTWRYGTSTSGSIGSGACTVSKGGKYYVTGTNGCTSYAVATTVNYMPVADAGPDITITGTTCSLFGTFYDQDGDAVTTSWSRQSGTGSISGSSNDKITVSGLSPGINVFRLTVTDANGISAYDEVTVNVVASDNNYNYRSVELIKVTNVITASDVNSLPLASKDMTYSYVDGLGKPRQEIHKAASPSGTDIVKVHDYDRAGRERTLFLPIVVNQSTGKWVDNVLGSITNYGTVYSGSLHQNFYNGSQQDIPADVAPYSQVDYEPVSSGRVVSSGLIGAGYQIHETHSETTYFTNTTSANIQNWGVIDGLPSANGFWPVNSLYIATTTNEQGTKTQVVKSRAGLTIVERTSTGLSEWSQTYYVYDRFNRLVFILPPELIKRISTTRNPEPEEVDQWVFQYQYDNFGRVIASKTPGAGWAYSVYDKRNRLVLSQSPKQGTEGEWSYTKFDEFDRPVVSGLYHPTTAMSRDELQQIIDAQSGGLGFANVVTNISGVQPAIVFNQAPQDPVYEAQSITLKPGFQLNADFIAPAWADFKAYTGPMSLVHHVFPTTDQQELVKTWYDSYTSCDICQDPQFAFASETFSSISDIPYQKFSRLNGLAVGTSVRILGTNNWRSSVNYYDSFGSVIQVVASNPRGGIIRTSSRYNFAGKLLETVDVVDGMRLMERFEYDAGGRPLSEYSRINQQPEVLVARMEYNVLGDVVGKNIHSINGSNALQYIDIENDIRGRLKRSNRSDAVKDADDPAVDFFGNSYSDYFAIEYSYQNTFAGGAYPRYDGTYSQIKWRDNLSSTEQLYSFTYDQKNQLTNSQYKTGKTGGLWASPSIKFDESQSYDNNGNIIALDRFGETQIDDLQYAYNDGNQLSSVTDAVPGETGFVDGNIATSDYVYDASGNVLEDKNKGLRLYYNHMNRVEAMVLGDGTYIDYAYDASGYKLSEHIRLPQTLNNSGEFNLVLEEIFNRPNGDLTTGNVITVNDSENPTWMVTSNQAESSSYPNTQKLRTIASIFPGPEYKLQFNVATPDPIELILTGSNGLVLFQGVVADGNYGDLEEIVFSTSAMLRFVDMQFVNGPGDPIFIDNLRLWASEIKLSGELEVLFEEDFNSPNGPLTTGSVVTVYDAQNVSWGISSNSATSSPNPNTQNLRTSFNILAGLAYRIKFDVGAPDPVEMILSGSDGRILYSGMAGATGLEEIDFMSMNDLSYLDIQFVNGAGDPISVDNLQILGTGSSELLLEDNFDRANGTMTTGSVISISELRTTTWTISANSALSSPDPNTDNLRVNVNISSGVTMKARFDMAAPDPLQTVLRGSNGVVLYSGLVGPDNGIEIPFTSAANLTFIDMQFLNGAGDPVFVDNLQIIVASTSQVVLQEIFNRPNGVMSTGSVINVPYGPDTSWRISANKALSSPDPKTDKLRMMANIKSGVEIKVRLDIAAPDPLEMVLTGSNGTVLFNDVVSPGENIEIEFVSTNNLGFVDLEFVNGGGDPVTLDNLEIIADNPGLKTEYVSGFVYVNDELRFITNAHGRILPPSYDNLIPNPTKDASALEGFQYAGNITLTTQNSNGESYVQVTCNQAIVNSGVMPIGSVINVKPGESYLARVLGYQAIGGSAKLRITDVNGTDLVPGVVLPYGFQNESWVELAVTIPANVTQIKIGVTWSFPSTGNSFLINKTALYNTDYEYQYFLNDHQGSPRVVLQTAPSTITPVATMESENYEDESSQFLNLQNTYYRVHNMGGTAPASNEVYEMTKDNRVGPARSFKVFPGDRFYASADAFYSAQSGYTDAIPSVIASALSAVLSGGSTIIDNAIQSAYAGESGGVMLSPSQGTSKPAAFLNYILFDENYNVLKAWSYGIENNAPNIKQTVAFDIDVTVQQLGYAFVYLSYDNESTLPVYFDNFNIVYKEGPVIQTTAYYPYGMAAYSWTREGEVENKYLYQGKEFNDRTKLQDFGSRQYDGAIARWLGVDPQGNKMPYMSTYGAMMNNPVLFTDPDGECPVCIGIFIGAAMAMATDMYKTWNGMETDDYSMLKGMLVGGISGGLGALAPVGVLPGMAYGAASGAVTGGIDAALNKQDIEDGMMRGAAQGAVTGGLKGFRLARKNKADIWSGESSKVEAITADDLAGMQQTPNPQAVGYNDKDLNTYRLAKHGSHPGLVDVTTKLEKGWVQNADGSFTIFEDGVEGPTALAVTKPTVWAGGRFTKMVVSKAVFADSRQLFVTLGHEYVHAYHFYYGLDKMSGASFTALTENAAHDYSAKAVMANGWGTALKSSYDKYIYYRDVIYGPAALPRMIPNFSNAPVNIIRP
jgi:RHS repeat-associated protein